MTTALQDSRGRFIGKPRKPRVTPGDTKACTRCHDEKDVGLFSPDKKNVDGLSSWCRPCRAEDMREKRRFARGELTPEEIGLRKLRLHGDVLWQRLSALLAAAREARSAGCWRGRSAIRAYRDLGLAIEAFHTDAPETRDAMDKEAPPCTCRNGVETCRRHADAAAAYLSIYGGTP
jgi:hypothetical protein